MTTYQFIHATVFYLVDLPGDASAAVEAERRAGTLRVEKVTLDGVVVVWRRPAIH